MRDLHLDSTADAKTDAPSGPVPIPGKTTLMEKSFPDAFGGVVQPKADGAMTAGALSQESPASGGQPLPEGVRGKMEGSFGTDFSSVRVHEDGRAGALGAQAYARGEDVHMAPGRYDPSSRGGQALLGHELSHVVQQREGRVPAAEGQGKDAAVVVDSGLEAEADREGERAADGLSARAPSTAGAAGGAAPVQGKDVVQLRPGDPGDPPAGRVAATHTFVVPPVIPIAAIPDAVNRNQAINQSYHMIDAAMTGYLGDPLVANWYTFGQHASREAGTQIRNLQMGLQMLNDALPILRDLAFGNPFTVISHVRTAVRIFQRMLDLMGQDAMIQQAMQLAFQKAGITEAEIRHLTTEAEVALAGGLVGGPVGMGMALPFVGHVAHMTGAMIVAIPPLISALRLISDNMVTGNREIYENVAPAASAFLAAAQGSPTGDVQGFVPRADPSGFMTAAFAEYVQVRKIGDDVRANPSAPDNAAKLADRQAKAAHANLLIGFQEQLVILQPLFDTMKDEMAAMSGTMVLHDPNGAHPLANNWQDFYTRMGIDPATAPKDPRTITPGNLPPLLPAAQRQGTIGSYFGDNITNEKVHEAPRDIAPG